MSWKLSIVAATLALAGCGAPAANPDVVPQQDVPGVDASMPPADAPAPTDAPPTACTYPAGPYGSDEGRLFRPFTLTNCDGTGTTYSFDNEDFCHNNVTLIVASAGWCVPCQMEAPMIEQFITQGYAGRGVRVLGIYFQNPDYTPPTVANCHAWTTRYHQTNTAMIDPTGMTQVYFPNMAYPANVIVDRTGRIRYRQYGTSSGLQTIRDQIDAILAEYGQ